MYINVEAFTEREKVAWNIRVFFGFDSNFLNTCSAFKVGFDDLSIVSLNFSNLWSAAYNLKELLWLMSTWQKET